MCTKLSTTTPTTGTGTFSSKWKYTTILIQKQWNLRQVNIFKIRHKFIYFQLEYCHDLLSKLIPIKLNILIAWNKSITPLKTKLICSVNKGYILKRKRPYTFIERVCTI